MTYNGGIYNMLKDGGKGCPMHGHRGTQTDRRYAVLRQRCPRHCGLNDSIVHSYKRWRQCHICLKDPGHLGDCDFIGTCVRGRLA